MGRRTAAEDSEEMEINSFLGMIDSRPDLLRGGSGITTGGGGVGGGSMIMSKTQAEEELKRFGSVYGSSPSSLDLNDASGMSGGRRSTLQRRPSKLSIEEEGPSFAGGVGTMDGEAKARSRPSPSSFPLRTSYTASRTNSPQPPSTISRFYTPTPPSASTQESSQTLLGSKMKSVNKIPLKARRRSPRLSAAREAAVMKKKENPLGERGIGVSVQIQAPTSEGSPGGSAVRESRIPVRRRGSIIPTTSQSVSPNRRDFDDATNSRVVTFTHDSAYLDTTIPIQFSKIMSLSFSPSPNINDEEIKNDTTYDST